MTTILLIWIEDARDNRTLYEYDGNGRRTAVTLAMNQRSTTAYNPVGNIEKYVDFNGLATDYEYDSTNRMTLKKFSDGSKVTYTYTATDLPYVVTFIDKNGQTEAIYDFDYDVRDRLTKSTDTIGGVSRSMSYEYDAAIVTKQKLLQHLEL